MSYTSTTNIISTQDLAAWLRIPLDSTNTPTLQLLVRLANGLVDAAWTNRPEGATPASVESLTLEVAARAWRNPHGLASWTRSVDDGSRTERLPDAAARAGVYLTVDERQELAGTPVGSSPLEWSGSVQMRS